VHSAGAASANPGVTVDFAMDVQEQFSGLAVLMFDHLRGLADLRAAKHLGGISFHSRFDSVGLQVADSPAFCMYRGEAYSDPTDNEDVRLAIHVLLKGDMEVKKFDKKNIDLPMPGYPPQLKEQYEKAERPRSSS